MNPTIPKTMNDELDADVLTSATCDINEMIDLPPNFVFGFLYVDGISATTSPTTSPLQIFDYSFEVAFFTCTHLVKIA